jgi:tetratricopeptide (TPR) repeat protein
MWRSDKRMKHAATAVALSIGLFVCAVIPAARAEPYEDTPDAAARDPDYAAGKAALQKKDWPEAVKRFHQAALRDPESADLHNYLGFSYRNLKQMDLAFKHYKRAIELNPRHRGAHEYIGEAYLLVDDPTGAEKHLAELRTICLLPCEELADLEKAIAAYRPKRK